MLETGSSIERKHHQTVAATCLYDRHTRYCNVYMKVTNIDGVKKQLEHEFVFKLREPFVKKHILVVLGGNMQVKELCALSTDPYWTISDCTTSNHSSNSIISLQQ